MREKQITKMQLSIINTGKILNKLLISFMTTDVCWFFGQRYLVERIFNVILVWDILKVVRIVASLDGDESFWGFGEGRNWVVERPLTLLSIFLWVSENWRFEQLELTLKTLKWMKGLLEAS